jgi:D-alanyl-D-alanine carboxypeptidase
MNLIKWLGVTFFSVLLLGTKSCEKNLPELSASDTFQMILNKKLEEFEGKGISAAISFNTDEIWSGESGISNGSLPIEENMVFCIGSVTKTFIAALCLQLVDEKLFNLDDPLHKWLPSYPNIDSLITVRQLLNNTSGLNNLSDNTNLWNSVFEQPSKEWTMDELLGSYVLEPYADPSDGWFYSNTNFILLGEIIRKSTGTDVSYQLRTRFFEPLGLDHTFFAVEEQLPLQLAHGWFDLSGDGSYNDISLISETGIYSVLWTSAAIFSTAKDLVKWCSALLNGDVLSESGLDDMLTQVCTMPGSSGVGCGMGIFLISSNNSTGVELIGYTGRTFGYLSSMFYMPEFGISVAVLINEDNAAFLDSVTTELILSAIKNSNE